MLLGILGEQILYRFFTARGFKVTRAIHGDLRLNDAINIEVKTIRRNKDNTYCATIRKPNSQHITNVDYIILLILESDNIYPYIIPASFVPHIKRIHITSHPKLYAGKYSQFLNAWNYLQISNVKIEC